MDEQKKAMLKEVIDELMAMSGIFNGTYDAKNGNEHFMYGVSTVLTALAFNVSEEYADEVEEIFFKNMEKSQEKVLTK